MAQSMWTGARWCVRSWVVAVLVGVLAGCGSNRPEVAPTAADKPQVVAVDPTPPPQPVEGPAAGARCELPPANATNLNCWKQGPELLDALETAMTAATVAHPENFDFEDMRCGNCYYVRDQDAYYAELKRQLQVLGVCSFQELDEITLKVSNGWSEQFDILLGSGHMRRGPGSYLYTCTPAMF